MSFPYIPEVRPRPLTPTPFQSQDAIANLGIFAHFPFEVRHQILVAAFGGRSLHLDMRYSLALPAYPKTNIPQNQANATDNTPSLDPEAASTWYWYSWVCEPWTPPRRSDLLLQDGHPCRYERCGNCSYGQDLFRRHLRPLERSILCSRSPPTIGALGWLLTCRQAYAEGIDVLYSTNHFIITRLRLLDALLLCRDASECPDTGGHRAEHRLILPQRLASINSLELRWCNYHPQRHQPPGVKLQLGWQIAALPGPFVNLRYLTLHFSSDPHAFSSGDGEAWPTVPDGFQPVRRRLQGWSPNFNLESRKVPDINQGLLQPVADAVSRLPLRAQMGQVRVELPPSVCDHIRRRTVLDLAHPVYGDDSGPGNGQAANQWLKYLVSPPETRPGDGTETGTGTGNGSAGSFYYITDSSRENSKTGKMSDRQHSTIVEGHAEVPLAIRNISIFYHIPPVDSTHTYGL